MAICNILHNLVVIKCCLFVVGQRKVVLNEATKQSTVVPLCATQSSMILILPQSVFLSYVINQI